jgi:hypothetical protein
VKIDFLRLVKLLIWAVQLCIVASLWNNRPSLSLSDSRIGFAPA